MITAIGSQKGGTGKTSTTVSLAAGLAHLGKKTLLVDIDSQANSSKVLLPDYQNLPKGDTIYRTVLERKPLPVHPTRLPHLALVPSHILLSNTDIELTTAIDHREARLKAELDKIAGDYDHVFIDCPPTLSWLTINAFTAADRIIVTVSPGYFRRRQRIMQRNPSGWLVRSQQGYYTGVTRTPVEMWTRHRKRAKVYVRHGWAQKIADKLGATVVPAPRQPGHAGTAVPHE